MTEPTPLGVLELTGRGAGFIRRRERMYLPTPGDVHVGQRVIQRFGLRTGDELAGDIGKPPGRGKGPSLTRLAAVNGIPPESLNGRPDFTKLGATHPNEQLHLDCGLTRLGSPDPTNRIIDLLCPFGKGQRALIVAPAKAGKTMVLQAVAEGVVKNHPDMALYILLVDERPEEITEMEMCGYGEVVASSFDFPPERHIAVAELTLERARRLVEMGKDAVIILDSITRLARAYNTVEKGTGRTLTGGLDASTMEKPKRFLGSARNVDPRNGGGSLTIIGTALIDTGSKMDQVIFEEFKGTGNSELVLSRELADRRIFPAIDVNASATRREELLLAPDTLTLSQTLRRRLANQSPLDAMNDLIGLMRRTKSNDELVKQVMGD
ncbi:MAG TPA: transcription termination factor Rho [Gemmatimonadales bacterium]|nr:transcription termination factor Rho [Gemmatimonadales bacterium]